MVDIFQNDNVLEYSKCADKKTVRMYTKNIHGYLNYKTLWLRKIVHLYYKRFSMFIFKTESPICLLQTDLPLEFHCDLNQNDNVVSSGIQ